MTATDHGALIARFYDALGRRDAAAMAACYAPDATFTDPVFGTLGVIGPTRMAYERVIPIVDVTAKLLTNALAQQMSGS